MDRSGVCQVPDGSGEQRKMEKTVCEVICGAPMILAVKGQAKGKVKVTAGNIPGLCRTCGATTTRQQRESGLYAQRPAL